MNMTAPLDRNRTVWQRLNAALLPHVQGENERDRQTEADRLTRALHGYVLAEKKDQK